ncbi:hypothetical protein PtrSN002B_011956, partial [Pyrenophora tritici-repentis]
DPPARVTNHVTTPPLDTTKSLTDCILNKSSISIKREAKERLRGRRLIRGER